MIHKTHLRWLRQSGWKPVLQFPGSGFQVWEHPEHGMARVPVDVELGLELTIPSLMWVEVLRQLSQLLVQPHLLQ